MLSRVQILVNQEVGTLYANLIDLDFEPLALAFSYKIATPALPDDDATSASSENAESSLLRMGPSGVSEGRCGRGRQG
jgi:hypothetical protein